MRYPYTMDGNLTDSLWFDAVIFIAAAAVILGAGIKLAAVADRLADRLGWGEAVTGSLLLGLTTALPGLAASITAALEGRAALAIGNAIGGIAIQTTFLAVADLAHRKANLEHAAASVANMIQTAILIALLALVLLGIAGPDITVAHVNPMTGVLFLCAVAGFWLVYRSRTQPMWKPQLTRETVEDVPDETHERAHLGKLLAAFFIAGSLVTAAGVVIARATGGIAERTGMNETLAGALLAGVATSLPELVTTVAAVRRGALTLAVSDIVGGNFFDILFVFAADAVYLQGSLYHAAGVGAREIFLTGLAISMNVVLLLGLLYRQRAGPANIGFESVVILLLYAGGFVILGVYM